MAKSKVVGPVMSEGRPETDAEFRDRCVDELFRAQWRGGQLREEPERGIVHDATTDKPHIWKYDDD